MSAEPYRLCSICDTPNPSSALTCANCGSSLVRSPIMHVGERAETQQYRDLHGETDLLEVSIPWRGATFFLSGFVAVIAVVCLMIMALLAKQLPDPTTDRAQSPSSPSTMMADYTILTNTAWPSVVLVTVTPAPPTVTRTFTPAPTSVLEPCVQQVQPGDSLIAILSRCGHRDYSTTLVQTVVQLNAMTDPNQLSIGQSIEVPWPSPTFDPNVTPTPAAMENSEATQAADSQDGFTTGVARIEVVPTETLQPGVTWYRVQKDDSMLSISFLFGANLQILSELNPEITFSQCDFGLGSGGPNCVVQLYEGQLVRVPAPTPTPTIQPTFSGSETPPPSATAVYNIPIAKIPSDRAFFGKDELITLRWVTTGTLSPAQQFLIVVSNITTGREFQATTRDLSFIIPEDWHSRLYERSDYRWSVAIVEIDRPANVLYSTEPRVFSWQGK